MIWVCGVHEVYDVAEKVGPSHIVSLLAPEDHFPEFPQHHHLKLGLDDIAEPIEGFLPPSKQAVIELIEFLRSWDKAKAPLISHCWAGISRSTATALIAAMLNSDETEEAIAWRLREASPTASPNRLIISYADEILGLNGRLMNAVEDIGYGQAAYNAKPFYLEV